MVQHLILAIYQNTTILGHYEDCLIILNIHSSYYSDLANPPSFIG